MLEDYVERLLHDLERHIVREALERVIVKRKEEVTAGIVVLRFGKTVAVKPHPPPRRGFIDLAGKQLKLPPGPIAQLARGLALAGWVNEGRYETLVERLTKSRATRL